MNQKTCTTLELDKIIGQLASYAAFSASEALLRALEPSGDREEVEHRQQQTSEARDLLDGRANVTVGGSRDIRPYVQDAVRGLVLQPENLLAIKITLLAGRDLRRAIVDSETPFPLLEEIAYGIDDNPQLVARIGRVLSDDGEVLDSASAALAQIRRDLQIAHGRLEDRLRAIVNNSAFAPYLQEALITMRGGRYVIPVKSEHKGRIQGIVHDQSSSGATLFIEPLATVEINNEIRELELAEQEEIRRILAELTAQVAASADPLTWTVEALAELDAAFARARYANALGATAPLLLDFDPDRVPGATVRLYGARHPLLDPRTVVPIDVELDDDTYVLVITGPNTGGKTVSLKTVGLLVLMAQCGLHIPVADGSALTVFEAVYADIGDEQSIEQSLSTFSAHLRQIIGILEHADSRSLVLLDELGSGTDPAEGAALARAILDELLGRGVTTFVATHYPNLKLYAHSTPGVRNASVEFDVETLSPTYHLIVGLPGRSNALAIASRLGLPEPIIEAARADVGQSDQDADDLLDEIHRSRQEIRQTQARLNEAEGEARALRAELQARLENIEEERRAIIEEAREQARAELDAVRGEVGEARRRVRRMVAPPGLRRGQPQAEGEETPLDELKAIEEEADTLEELIAAPVEAVVAPPPVVEKPEASPRRALRVGDRVYIPSLSSEGQITELTSGSNVEVQVGALRVRVDADQLELRGEGGPAEREEAAESGVRFSRPASPGVELHLRGLTLDEALPRLDDYLDQAYLSGLPWVRIVHGKGAGILREAIRRELRNNSLVREFKTAPLNEGGDGVTLVYFVA